MQGPFQRTEPRPRPLPQLQLATCSSSAKLLEVLKALPLPPMQAPLQPPQQLP